MEGDREIRHKISCFNPFAHSQVIFRKSAFLTVGGYDQKLHIAQDYDLWVRLLGTGEGHNLDYELGAIRVYENSFSRQNEFNLFKEVVAIKWKAYRRLSGSLWLTGHGFFKTLTACLQPARVLNVLFRSSTSLVK